MRVNVLVTGLITLLVAAIALGGCSRDNPAVSEEPTAEELGLVTLSENTLDPPPGLVTVAWAGEELTFWPFTGENFSGIPKDPINLVFVGEAAPVQIRAALVALDGDRTAFGFPSVHPFNATWSEALGDVQTAFSEDAGWVGSVVQLQLGSYAPVRVHLRFFSTGKVSGADGTWTLGGAHFEIAIPGTPQHQVICWELAEQLVVVDLIRSGLLDPVPPAITGVIGPTPTYRDIPAAIYNGVPDGLKVACGLPPGPTADPAVPIPSDGTATILQLVGAAPVIEEEATQSFVIDFNQVIPKPFCMTGPADFFLVQGPVELFKATRVRDSGRYGYRSRISGELTATPLDITQQPPVPVGPSFQVRTIDVQDGSIHDDEERVLFITKRIAPQDGGVERVLTELKVGTNGRNRFRARESCLAP